MKNPNITELCNWLNSDCETIKLFQVIGNELYVKFVTNSEELLTENTKQFKVVNLEHYLKAYNDAHK